MSKVLIVGGGFGGLAAAVRFREAGWNVDLVDLNTDWTALGAGITITGPTLRAYQRLGVIDEIKTQGAITPGSRVLRYDGTFVQDLDEPPIEEGLPATGGIMRPVLHKIMQRRLDAVGGGLIRLGTTVTSLENRGESVEAVLSDGRREIYDLVIGSDGVHSRVRELAFPHMLPLEYTGQGCWRVLGQRPPGFQRGEFYLGHQNPAGITVCGPDNVYLWMMSRDLDHKLVPEMELVPRLREHLKDFGGNAGWVRDRMTEKSWANYRPLAARLQPRPWYNGHIVLLGDACHATTPHLASGAGMAVESAIVLAEEVQRPGRPLGAALAAYEDRRYERCRHVVEASIAVGRLQLAGASAEEIGNKIGEGLHGLAQSF